MCLCSIFSSRSTDYYDKKREFQTGTQNNKKILRHREQKNALIPDQLGQEKTAQRPAQKKVRTKQSRRIKPEPAFFSAER